MCPSKEGVPRFYLISATAKGIKTNFEFVCIDESQLTEIHCLIETSVWFAMVKLFAKSRCLRLQTLNI